MAMIEPMVTGVKRRTRDESEDVLVCAGVRARALVCVRVRVRVSVCLSVSVRARV